MKYYLLEKYSPEIKFDRGSAVIAMTPQAIYELDKAGINYQIIEEFYAEEELVRQAEVYLEEQIKWFEDFDRVLFNIFPEAKEKKLKLATSFFYHIKLMVDAVVLRSKIIAAFLNKARPKEIVYTVNHCKNNAVNAEFPSFFTQATFSLSLESQSLFFTLLPLFCKKYGINLEQVVLDDPAVIGENGKICPKKGPNKFLNINNYIKAYKDLFLRPTGIFRHNLFFLNSGYNNYQIMDEARLAGSNIFYADGDVIKARGRGLNRIAARIQAKADPEISAKAEIFLSNIHRSNTLDWINHQCGVDVYPVILPKLRSFISVFFPRFISLINGYVRFYDQNQIDLLFSAQVANVEEYAAIVACQYSKKTKSIYMQHGDTAFNSDWIDFCEYRPKFDAYFTNNSEIEARTRQRMLEKGFKTKVYQGSVRYSHISRLTDNQRKASASGRKTVVYVPATTQWDLSMWLDIRFPDTWYFMWQKELLKFFASRQDIHFIWKGIPAANQCLDQIPQIISDNGYSNIQYATDPFINWINKTDMVLLDQPSTPLYESAISGIPVMSLFFAPYSVIRKTALDLFGMSLQPFHSFQEGIEKINNFLDANPGDFIVSIPSSGQVLKNLDAFLAEKVNA